MTHRARARCAAEAILTALATISRDRGSFEKATGYARRLVELRPQDPFARQLLQQIRATSEARE
jgi:hypothetical protein